MLFNVYYYPFGCRSFMLPSFSTLKTVGLKGGWENLTWAQRWCCCCHSAFASVEKGSGVIYKWLRFLIFLESFCFLLKYELLIRTAILFCPQKSLDLSLQWNMLPHKFSVRNDSDLLRCWWMLFYSIGTKRLVNFFFWLAFPRTMAQLIPWVHTKLRSRYRYS